MDKTESSQIENKAKIFLFVILFANFFRNLEISIIDIGLPDFVISLAGTISSYGLVISIFSLTTAIFQFPVAAASDKVGRRIIIIISILIYSFGTFLCFLAQNILQLIIFRAIQGIGAYSSILQAMIGDHYKKKHGKGMALYSFTLTLGYFAGYIIGGLISFHFGSRSIFLIACVLAIISVILISFFLKDTRKQYLTNENDNSALNLKETIKISEIKIILKENQFKFVLLINSVRWFLFFGIYAYIIWMIEIFYDFSYIETILLLILIVLLYAIFVMIGGIVADRIGHKKTMIFGQILIIVFGLLFFIADSLIIFIIVSIFASIGFAILEISINAYLSKILEETHPNLKSSGFGFNNALGFFFSAIGPIFICSLGEIYIFLPYYIVSILISVLFLITIKFIKT